MSGPSRFAPGSPLPPGIPRALVEANVQSVVERETHSALTFAALGLQPAEPAPPGSNPLFSIEQGRRVTEASGRHQPWLVAGQASDGQLQLIRPGLEQGRPEVATRSWAELWKASPDAFVGKPIVFSGRQWTIEQVVEEPQQSRVKVHGSDGGTRSVDRSRQLLRNNIDDVVPRVLLRAADGHSRVVPWTAVARQSGIDFVTPRVVGPASISDAARQLVDVLHPSVAVLDGVDGQLSLLGTDVTYVPPRHRAAVDEVLQAGAWGERTSGVQFIGHDLPALVTTNNVRTVANASAGVIEGGSIVNFGPPPGPLLEGLLKVEGRSGIAAGWGARRGAALIDQNFAGVTAHELGHIITGRAWADLRLPSGPPPGTNPSEIPALVKQAFIQQAELGVIGEALSDLKGAAYERDPDLGVRHLARLDADWATLPKLRASMEAGAPIVSPEGRLLQPPRFDVHEGTQLITKPMLAVARRHGWDAMAEVTGAAIRKIGQDITSGAIEAPDIPLVAKELRDAAAWRYGESSKVVKELEKSWRSFRVLL